MGGVDVTIRDSGDFAALSRRIKTHGDAKALRRELYRGLNRSTKSLRKEMVESVADSVPSSGGLADRVRAKGKLTMSASSSAKGAGVRIKTARKGANLPAYNIGRFRHPVFGNRKVWEAQSKGVTPGGLDRAFDDGASEVRRDVINVLEDIARKVEG